mgnify:CR=1 FL=1
MTLRLPVLLCLVLLAACARPQEGITLRFTEGAYKAIAQKAIARKSGARGLRSVMEECVLDVMYELPSDEHATECVINEQVITSGEYPVILYDNADQKKLA